MKQLQLYITFLLTLLLCGCTATEEPEMCNGEAIKVKLILNDGTVSRGPALVLKEYPNMFLYFKETNTTVQATYSEADNTYTIASGASLAKGSGTCTIICAGARVDYSASLLKFYKVNSYPTVCDTQAFWSYDGKELTLITYLKPLLQRLRFVSASPVKLQYKGPTAPTCVAFSKNGLEFDYEKYNHHWGCRCKTIDISQKGEDGQYYSDYILVDAMGCNYASHYYAENQYVEYSSKSTCVAHDYLYIYNPLKPTYCYRKKLPKFTGGDATLIRYPVNLQNGWQEIPNKIRTCSRTLYMSGNSMTKSDYGYHAFSYYSLNPEDIGTCINYSYSSSNGGGALIEAELWNTDFPRSLFLKALDDGTYSSTIESAPIYLLLSWTPFWQSTFKASSNDWAEIKFESISYFPIYKYTGEK